MFKLTNYAWAMALCAGMVACSGGVVTQADYQVIPLPQAVNLQGGQPFVLKPPAGLPSSSFVLRAGCQI